MNKHVSCTKYRLGGWIDHIHCRPAWQKNALGQLRTWYTRRAGMRKQNSYQFGSLFIQQYYLCVLCLETCVPQEAVKGVILIFLPQQLRKKYIEIILLYFESRLYHGE